MTAAMRTVYWMAKEDLPIKKYPSFISFQQLQGSEAFKNMSVAANATYSSRQAGEEFQGCVAEVIYEDVIQKFKDAVMFTIMVDESTDISVSKQQVIYGRVVDKDFNVQTHFLKNITVTDSKSDAEVLCHHILQYLEEEGLDMSKLYGFGSDGAAVMIGRHSGVATRLKELSPHCINIHCLAHRFNLSTSQASQYVQYLTEVEEALRDLFYYFGGSKSGNRKCELEEIQRVLDDPVLVVKIKECHQIRWIAFSQAAETVYKSWSSLVTYFKRHDDKKSKTFLKRLSGYRFLYVQYKLMDILPSVAQMSRALQKQDLDAATVSPALNE